MDVGAPFAAHTKAKLGVHVGMGAFDASSNFAKATVVGSPGGQSTWECDWREAVDDIGRGRRRALHKRFVALKRTSTATHGRRSRSNQRFKLGHVSAINPNYYRGARCGMGIDGGRVLGAWLCTTRKVRTYF